MITYQNFKKLKLPENIISYCTSDIELNWGTKIHIMYMVNMVAVGYGCLYSLIDDKYSVYLEGLSVSPEFQKMGIGLELQEVRENIAKDLGAKQVFLWVDKNSWMYYWYIRRGYTYYKKNKDELDCVWMVKQI